MATQSTPGTVYGSQFGPSRGFPQMGQIPQPTVTVSTLATAGAITYTADQFLGGLILRDPNGAGRTDLLPTALSVLQALPGAAVNQSFQFDLRNTADASETITLSATNIAGATISGTATIAQNNSKRFLLVVTSIDPASPAYTLYSLGTSTF
jgi:hypothetical protein